tara:strand:- start:16568 stop:17326 length:759 start_codon:yes stop_codon:yes gene_type:complete
MNYIKVLIRALLAPWIVIKNLILYYYGHYATSKFSCTSSLKKKGYYFFNEKLDIQSLNVLRYEFDRLLELNELSSFGQNNGRILIEDHLNIEIRNLVVFFREKAKDYFKLSFVDTEIIYFQKSKKELEENNVPGGVFHLDDNKKNLKFFVYLDDVSVKNGPFKYVENSHGPFSFEKIYRWFFWELTLSRKFLYSSSKRKFESTVSIIGPAGSMFCADTTGFHKAEKIEEGTRKVFVVSFAETRFDPYSFLKK